MAVFGGVTVTYIFLEFEHLETGFNDLEADPEMYCSLTTSDHESWQYTSVLPWLAIRTQFYLTEASERGSWRGVSFRLLDGPLHVQWRAILSFFNFSQSITEVPKKAGRSWSHSALPWDGRAGGECRRCCSGIVHQEHMYSRSFPTSYFIISSSTNLNWWKKKYPPCDSLDHLNGYYFCGGRKGRGRNHICYRNQFLFLHNKKADEVLI